MAVKLYKPVTVGFTRESVMKAHGDLIRRGIIASENRPDISCANADTGQTLKVA